MDQIHIDKLLFKGKHGHYEHERKVEQEFEVSLCLLIDAAPAGASDKLADTVDYDAVKRAVEEIIAGPSRYLIEKLGADIAGRLLEDSRIAEAQVTIKKTAVWDNGIPGVTVTRKKVQ